MKVIRFSLKQMLVTLLLLGLVAANLVQIQTNKSLRDNNRVLRSRLGIPANIARGRVYVCRADNAPVTTPFHWAWRVFLPEGCRFQVLTKTQDIPMLKRVPTDGDVMFELPPGEIVLRAHARRAEKTWNVDLLAEVVTGWDAGRTMSASLECDRAFFEGGGSSFEPTTDGASANSPIVIFKALSSEASVKNANLAESGLAIWLVPKKIGD